MPTSVSASTRGRTTGGQGLEPRSPGPKPGVAASWTTPKVSWAPESTSERGHSRSQFRPTQMRTCVRAQILRRTSQRRRRVVAVLLGGSAEAGSQAGGKQPPSVPQIRGRNLADPDGSLHPQRVRIAKLKANRPQRPIPLELVLVSGSNYSRTKLKQRLYQSGLKSRNCELCGQGEEWRGNGCRSFWTT